ncbi:hypothetical protein M422DRAFT_779491 [Sphaerobolus stellatus SS14]|uniref:Integral membrane protein n=1 Tax=Sphaerobolus stellatus (strain SS14) TaxID=990650 RepID=A0A0C9VPE3_SPHS4|nr:hypothetical protein M422DRAFT_779491 [Sphaerobolus stellatus SS14]
MPASYFGYVAILVGGMILTGATNSIFTKDMQCVEDCNTSRPVVFEQPVWQTLQMFLGEMLCFLPIAYSLFSDYLKSHQRKIQLPSTDEEEPIINHAAPKHVDLAGWRVLLLWIPAACDLTGTTLMNVGLLYTPVSIYQMTRGSLVLFVGMLSVAFLRRRLWLYQWVALITVMFGVSVVGLSGSMIKDSSNPHELPGLALAGEEELPVPEPTSVLIGVFFIIFAQIFTATQFVVEEKIMSQYSVPPLLAVGYEGLFGCISVLLAMPLLAHFADKSPFFDLTRGWTQIISTPTVLYSSIAIAISIALFNGFGLSVTRHLSATARSVIDTCRTLLIWVISLGLGWERLVFPVSLLQIGGFGLLVYGTFLFNNLINPPKIIRPAVEAIEERGALLREDVLEETAALPADLGASGYDVVPPPTRGE